MEKWSKMQRGQYGLGKLALQKYRKMRYEVNPRQIYLNLDHIKIDRPIFLLGTQGGGLTIIMKALQRHGKTCFCYGNKSHWDAADNELFAYLQDKQLPKRFSFLNNPEYHPKFKTDHFRYWTYALNETISMYRIEPESIEAAETRNFGLVIKKVIRAYARDPLDCRFIDKSQLYTINIPAVNKALYDSEPYFILISRDPYAMCKRVEEGYYNNPNKHNFPFTSEQSLRYCAQHWANSFRSALEDGHQVKHFMHLRFEDFLTNPGGFLRQICEFANLEFDPDIVPGPNQNPTRYAQMKSRWYPINTDVNERYYKRLDQKDIDIIRNECGGIARQIGYDL